MPARRRLNAGDMTLDLTFIGTGNAFAPTRYWSSFLEGDRCLFDAPPTLLAHLKKLGKDPRDVEVAFISHFHGDHFFGLPFLMLECARAGAADEGSDDRRAARHPRRGCGR